MITQQRLKELLHYDPETGIFTWAKTRRNVKIGARAGSERGSSGYRVISVFDHAYYEHRLAWLWMIGDWPAGQVDHKNMIRTDNRWENLRDVTQSVNQQNKQRATVRSSIGLLGASPPRNGRKRFKSTIQVNKKSIHLGYHDTPEQAHAAYVAAKRILHEGALI